jgi:hypothetical protein
MRFANNRDKINSFPKAADSAQSRVTRAGASAMSTINWFTRPTYWNTLSRNGFASAFVRAALRIRASFWRHGWNEDVAWSALNDHLLRDIGETRASAQSVRMSHPSIAPLGTVGGHAHSDGRPLLSFRTSPLG